MPLEKGGRADKFGNKYEINYTIYQILNVLDEKIYSVTLEALGEDEIGTDLLIVNNKNSIKEHIQCKARNASSDEWDIGTLNRKGIFKNWKCQLDRGQDRVVSLVSPISCTYLVDLNNRANNTSCNYNHFYNEQILKSSKDFQDFYKKYCKAMGLENETGIDILKSIDYLSRTFYKQLSEHEIQELINQKIFFLFSTDISKVYDALISIVINNSILGQELTTVKLSSILDEKEILFRSIGIDHRIKPRFNELNEEYDNMFFPLSSGFVQRPETNDCIDLINSGESFIISGKAGFGKSGCTQEIIYYCKKENIPYIAIKLDKRIPVKTAKKWSDDLGLPEPIPHCLHKISINDKAVIILDQLDALRWTQSNSYEATTVCMEIIRQVRYLNQERENKISIIFVCRTYDLENDSNIKKLFQREKSEKDVWKKVIIDSFDNKTVKTIVGKKYDNLGIKSKQLLSIPSNIYIWQQLDTEINYDDCLSTSHLIRKWYEQIKRKSLEYGVLEGNIESIIDTITSAMDRIGKLYIHSKILKDDVSTLDYLKSSGMINIVDDKVSFVHQSFIDYFISAKMLIDYYKGEDILSIIGDKNKQTPARRYQIQMLMQDIQSDSNEDFLYFGSVLLESREVRYYVKYIFYELLSQIEKPDKYIEKFILLNIDDEKIINTIVHSRKNYISILRENNILDKWYSCETKRATVIKLLKSINQNYDDQDVLFMSKYALNSEEEARVFSSCFWYDINSDTDSMFELRMSLYEKYPNVAKDAIIDFKSILTNCEMRAIRLLALWMEQKNRKKEKDLFGYEEELLHPDDTIFITHGNDVLDEMLKYIPLSVEHNDDWSSKYFIKKNLERTFVEIIKKANLAVIKNDPQFFFKRYENYWKELEIKDVFNEIILDSFYHLPKEYSDKIMEYLVKTPKENLVDETSGDSNKLRLLKKVLEKHTYSCNKEILDSFIKQVILYKPSDMVEMYRDRISKNKSNDYAPIYYTFWGDFQYEVLQSIAEKRLTVEAHSLLVVLRRRFSKMSSRYAYRDGSHGGWVLSPVSGKDIGINQWIQIISNTKLSNRNRTTWVEVKGGFLESSIQIFASDFKKQVMKDPVNMISIVIENKPTVLEAYINVLFSGVAESKLINTLDKDLLMKMFVNFPYDLQNHRANGLCEIVSKRSDIDWPTEIFAAVIDIALNHTNEDIENLNVTKLNDNENMPCEIVQSNAYNCIRGNASRTIGSLINDDKSLIYIFKETIKKLSEDENIVIRYASLWSLFPAFNIDKDWASDLIVKVYESDIRLCCFHDTRHMFHILPTQYRDRVYNIIRNCLFSNEENLIRAGAYSLVEMYFLYGAFEDVISNITNINKKQSQYILEMIIIYYNLDKYNKHSKELILEFVNKKEELGDTISRIFYDDYVNISRDKDFLLDLVKTKASKKIISAFIIYLEKSGTSIIEFSDIILMLCKNILDNNLEELEDVWGIEDNLSKLIINLYDESLNKDKSITFQCMELWDIMFEKQIGSIRNISKELMDR